MWLQILRARIFVLFFCAKLTTSMELTVNNGSQNDTSNCSGPETSSNLHRLGNTKFFVFQNANRTNLVNWYEARKMCKEVGLKLAKIDDLQTDVLIGRELERFIRPKGWIDNWYWLDAKFDRVLKTYVWQDTMKAINFSNFYYRHPRPKGYGDFFDIKGNYQSKPTIEHCLAQSMPLPFPKTYGEDHNKKLVPFGFHTAWWERLCDSKKKGNVLCETIDRRCHAPQDSSIYPEASENYYEEFWPMSNRRFVVMWSPRSFEEANSLCEEHKLKLYSPHEDDTCLSQNLKNWMNTVTSYSFWTDVKYNVKDRTYEYPDGKEVPPGARNFSLHLQKRDVDSEIVKTCVSVTWNFEEFPKIQSFCNCTFNSLVLSPENCKNRIGTICQHPDDKPRNCTTEYYEKSSDQDELLSVHPDNSLKIREYFPFDSNTEWNDGIMRSSFKQQGSSDHCPIGYFRVNQNNTYWGTEEDFEKSNHTYDFLSPYWMKMSNGTCHLSTVSYNATGKKLSRELIEEDCSKWLGFVLCQKISNVSLDSKGRSISNDSSLSTNKPERWYLHISKAGNVWKKCKDEFWCYIRETYLRDD